MRTTRFRSTPRSRDRHRLGVAAVTGAATAVSFTATGWAVGLATADFEAEQAERDAAQARADRQRARYERQLARAAAASRPQAGLRERPTRTRVTTRYVRAGAPAAVGGGELTVPVTSSVPSGSGSGNGSGGGSGSGPSGGSSSSSSGTSTPPPPPPPPPSTSGS